MSFPFGSAEIQMPCTIHYSRNPWHTIRVPTLSFFSYDHGKKLFFFGDPTKSPLDIIPSAKITCKSIPLHINDNCFFLKVIFPFYLVGLYFINIANYVKFHFVE